MKASISRCGKKANVSTLSWENVCKCIVAAHLTRNKEEQNANDNEADVSGRALA